MLIIQTPNKIFYYYLDHSLPASFFYDPNPTAGYASLYMQLLRRGEDQCTLITSSASQVPIIVIY